MFMFRKGLHAAQWRVQDRFLEGAIRHFESPHCLSDQKATPLMLLPYFSLAMSKLVVLFAASTRSVKKVEKEGPSLNMFAILTRPPGHDAVNIRLLCRSSTVRRSPCIDSSAH